MNEQWIEDLRGEWVDTDPRPGFQDDLRSVLDAEWEGRTNVTVGPRPQRRRWWALGAAAASVAVLVAGLVVVTSSDDAGAPDLVPADRITPPATVGNPDDVTPATSLVQSPMTVPAPAPSSVPDATTESTTPSSPGLPRLLEGWPAGTDAVGRVEDVPTLLPAEPVPDAIRVVRNESVGGGLAFDDYVQTFYDTDRNAWLLVRTVIGQPPTTAGEFRIAPVDTAGWADQWTNSYLVRSGDNMTSIELTAPGGLVRINALNVDDDTVIELARTMQRRPAGQPGWDLALPAGMQPFTESEAGPEARRSVVWFDADLPRAELAVDLENAEGVTTGWSEVAQTDTIDLDGTPAVLTVEGVRVTIAWTTREGAEVVFGYRGDRDTAERIARSIEAVDESTWIAAGVSPDPNQDGCQSLFC